MKRIVFIIALICPFIANGQVFLDSADYVYGVASSKNEVIADSLALISFSRAVGVSVESVSDSRVWESNLKISREYSNNTVIKTSFNINGIKKHVDFFGDVYTVYYYFNKSEYVSKILKKYNDNVQLCDEYWKQDFPHSENLAIGSLYIALETIDEEAFKAFCPDYERLRSYIMYELSYKYCHMGFLLSGRYTGSNGEPSATLLVRDENARTLPGFEYYSHDGRWVQPRRFLDINAMPCSRPEDIKWAYVDNTNREYRFIYETMVNGLRVKIDVPEEFYNLVPRKFYFF